MTRSGIMAGVEVEVVVAHHECATRRVGDVFLKIDADQTTVLGRLGEPSAGSPAAWAAAGATARMLHDAPLPPWPGRSPGEIASHLDGECEWLLTNGVLPADVVTRNRRDAEAALRRPRRPRPAAARPGCR
jgi:hypothetical protein